MANPLQVANLAGTLVCASATSTGSGIITGNELNTNIGTTIANSGTLTTGNVSCKAIPESLFALVKLSSGTAVITLDVSSTGGTPTFLSSSAKSVTVTHGEPVYVGPVNTVASTVTDVNGVITVTKSVTNVAAIQIVNNSGAVLTLQELRLMCLTQLGNSNNAFDSRTADLYSASGEVHDGSGTFLINT